MSICGRDYFQYSFPLSSIVIESLIFDWGRGNTEYRLDFSASFAAR